ncbi:heparinase II/III family protein [Candidatus Binatia bacterium]|nr:heparinase II/III family protein [Candidatus Binatia bacterium]
MPTRITTLLVLVLLAAPLHVRAAWAPSGIDLTRPRILFRAGDVPALQARVVREPYAGILRSMRGRTNLANGVALDDHGVDGERIKARAAKNLAFLYAIDRTLDGNAVVPFPTADARAAVGTRVHELLLAMYTRHRVAVPPPLGGWDRDISSSEELLQYATAYDTMLGAGWDFGSDRAAIEQHIVDLASEMYENYVDPDTASGFTRLHQNNHRAKSAAAMATAAIAVAEYTPPPGSDPRGVRDPARWLEYGLDQMDLVMRHVLVTADGAYGEGPFYLRYAAQNLIPFARAWDRLVNGADWNARVVTVPSLWRHPLWLRTQRWMLDMTLPDGSMAPIDDGNPGRSYYFGLLPPGLPWAAAAAWRWANAPQPIDTDGNIDLGADAIALFDDTVVPAAPDGPTTAFYHDGGNAIFRSDWSSDAVVVNAQAEHDTASEFGRDRDGRGVFPQSHEHAEPGAFLLHAFGERLALDPGYLSFTEHGLVNRPEHHNLILVDGAGPVDYLTASFAWQDDPFGPPPADGQAYLSDTIDGTFLDAATVRTSYGLPPARRTDIERRFLFGDDRYLAIFDDVSSPGATARTFTWVLHGNGGGTSGGTFEQTASGGRWTRPLARLDAGIGFDRGAPSIAITTGQHEAYGKVLTTHSVLNASTTADRPVGAIQLLYPSRSGDPAPVIERRQLPFGPALVLGDEADDRRMAVAYHRSGLDPIRLTTAVSGIADAATDGSRALFDGHLDLRPRLAWADDATSLRYGEVELQRATPGSLGFAIADDRAEVVAEIAAGPVSVRGLGFAPQAADGACSLAEDDGTLTIGLSREGRVTLRRDAGNSAPAADPGPDRMVPQGARVLLDASASCDLDGDALTASWELVQAPIGADWRLDDGDTPLPSLLASSRGIYRLRLTVTDAHGAASRPHDLVVRAVAPEEDPDGDLVPDDLDNCAVVANPDQRDVAPATDGGNGVGDACECTDGTCIAGGGTDAFDCAFEIRALRGAANDGARRITCRDGDACDADATPGVCGFDVQLCLASHDAARPACTSFAPASVRITNWLPGGTRTLLDALAALPGSAVANARTVTFTPPLATSDVCSAPIRLTVPAPGRSLNVTTRGTERAERDADRVRFVCAR